MTPTTIPTILNTIALLGLAYVVAVTRKEAAAERRRFVNHCKHDHRED